MVQTLITTILQMLSVELKEVHTDWREETIDGATPQIRQGEDVKALDCRPSDALNLAVMAGSPIYVAEDAFAQGGRPYPEEVARWRAGKGS